MAKHRAGEDRSNRYAPEGTEYPTQVETSDAGRTAPKIDLPDHGVRIRDADEDTE